jgi:hypothetical protein
VGAQAGRLGAVTVATNMAGRGTDILLGGSSKGLAKALAKSLLGLKVGTVSLELQEEAAVEPKGGTLSLSLLRHTLPRSSYALSLPPHTLSHASPQPCRTYYHRGRMDLEEVEQNPQKAITV